ncbi:MAG: molybdopterin-dependent oxidoreductase [Marinobacter sp.]|uniref:nitrate reductase n=1 Tax=Marinobacter sp. TaxID=50741 RepID=UPI00299EE5AC|nr:molybdopterin-dependent oxidoreductase [Marinobacter sp.]MDX1633679.1 molybdopterin-dependent oxidoreductase [Marinobacter sp.]
MTEADTTNVRTTCPYCGVGCGVLARSGSPVAGDPAHPASQGRLCVKGTNLGETLGHGERLLKARVADRNVDLDEALDATADAIRQAIAEQGPESVAFYLSGQLLTEDYYVANKLAKGFVGTPHVDTNSRLCMSSAVAAHKRAFGADAVPACYDDLELADLLVLSGSNTAWNHPILYQRMKASARPGRRVVVIDPRQTATTELADLHLMLRPGSDSLLFNGLLVWLADQGLVDLDYLGRHCEGYPGALAAARRSAPDIATVAAGCDLPAADVECFYRWFGTTAKTVTAFSQGVNQSVAGTDKANAIINCHLATGRVGRPGASPFSLTGQPNAMGGREVGGLANTLAAHMDYECDADRDRVTRFWRAPALASGPGLKAVDLLEAVHRGDIKVIWIMATNPAVSLPDNARVRAALARCPTVIVSDCVARTDTTAFADILLPAAGWGEKDGTVTNSERCISRQRRFLPLPGDARPDWWLLAEVGKRLGHSAAFDYDGPAAIFREHAALSAFENQGRRVFNLAGLSRLSDADYDRMTPRQWPIRSAEQSAGQSRRLFADGRYCHPDGRARLVAIDTVPPGQQPDHARPLIVNTGRVRDQWHTMTRTARSPRLLQHRSEAFIEVHPVDAAGLGLVDGGLGSLENQGGRFLARVRVSAAQRPGEVFIPIHWNRQFASQALASELIAPVTDPVSGQPESKHGIASLRPFPASWHARLLTRHGRAQRWRADYWSRVPLAACDRWQVAGLDPVPWPEAAADWLGGAPQLVMADRARGLFRAARIEAGQLQAVLLVDSEASRLPDTDWLANCFGADPLSETQRRTLLACRDVAQEDIGPVVCSCFQVGQRQIEAAVAAGHRDVAALGRELRCGTNCGSCLPELKELLATSAELAP